jgi:hypothetical protein
MGHFKFGGSGVALALSAGAALMPAIVHGETPPASDTSSVISQYGMSAATADDTLASNLGSDNSNAAVALESDSPATIGNVAIPEYSPSAPTLDAAAVSASGGPIVPDFVPEPATASIALIAGVGMLMHRRRKPLA